jgi:hypothetical protein
LRVPIFRLYSNYRIEECPGVKTGAFWVGGGSIALIPVGIAVGKTFKRYQFVLSSS